MILNDPIAAILKKDPRYPRAAYDFVREALQHTVSSLGEKRHISARQLMEGTRDYGREQFGPLALTVFASWGVRDTRDFGAIVFNLVDAGEMGKTDEDDVKDFENVFRLEEAFPTDAGEAAVLPRGDEDE